MNRFLPDNPPGVQPAGPGPAAGPDWATVLRFVLVVLVWGSTWYVIKDQVGTAPVGWTVVARFLVAFAGMAALALVRRESLRLPPGTVLIALLIGATQFCLNFQFVYRAEMSLTSGIMAVIIALMIIPTAVLSWLIFRIPIDRRFLAGSAVALGGICLLLVKEYRSAPPTAGIAAGLAFGVAALFSATAASLVQLGARARAAPLVPLVTWAMGFGVLLDAGFAFAMHGPPPLDLPARFWGGTIYLGIVGSVVPFPIYFGLIRRIGAARATYVNVAIPVVAMVISTVLEGYRWTALAAAGATLAMVGLLIVLSARRA